MNERWRTLLALTGLATLPWALACLVTAGEVLLGSGSSDARRILHALFLESPVLIPLVALAGYLEVNLLLPQQAFSSANQHWVAGGILALTASVAVATVGLVIAGAVGVLLSLVWVLFSGFWAFTWVAGVYTWKRLAIT
jgi:hypothetical protein